VAGGLTLATIATEAYAKSRSSGGYSRPSTSSSRSSTWSSSRTPSTSRGYTRPSLSGSSRPSTAIPPSRSAGDVAISRQRSADALGAYRASQVPRPAPAAPAPGAAPRSAARDGGSWTDFWTQGRGRTIRPPERQDWYAQGGWTSPGPIMGAQRSFGIWDGLFLWALLSNLNRPGSAEFFHNHQNDPGYQQWRAEADRLAADNATLRQRLESLDRELGNRRGQPIDDTYLPPTVPAAVALAAHAADRTPSVAPDADDGGNTAWLVVAIIVGGGVVAWFLWQRLRAGGTGDKPMRNLGTAGNMLRHKLAGGGYRPDHFRVGMTFAYDPTPFILAAGATKVLPPVADTGSRRLTATAIGTLAGQGFQLLRLYLPDDRSFFQMHLDAGGRPDECRFFSIIDVITPADPSEWGAWLDTNEGMIGWPQFQTRDGRLYDRVWAPGGGRIAPMAMDEAIEGTDQAQRRLSRGAMLYAAPTGAAAPAPETEYILVSAVQEGGQAWIEIAAGIDVNPGMLELS